MHTRHSMPPFGQEEARRAQGGDRGSNTARKGRIGRAAQPVARLGRFLPLALAALLPITVPARAQVPSTPDFRAFAFAGVSDGHSYFILNNFAPSYADSPVPINISITNQTQTYSGPLGDVTFTATAAANYRGFWSSGTYAEGRVDNVYYPTDAPYHTSPPFGYYVVGGIGSWTRHRFVTPESLNDVFAQFHWHVSGETDVNFGTANSRLDFGVGQNVPSFNDLYNSQYVPNLLTRFGPGEYSYTTGVALDTPLDFLFWSSSYWEVDPDQLANLPSNMHEIHGIAEFTRTFNIDRIDLYNGDPNNGGTLITDWSLLDEATNQVIFNQNGRVIVPEPGSLALLVGVSLSGLAVLRRRRRK